MSFLKDKKYVKDAVDFLEKRDISDEACRFLLSNVELNLRILIEDSLKFCKKFKRSNLIKNDVLNALKNKNLSYPLLNTQFQTKYHNENDKFVLNNEVISIKDEMKNTISKNLIKKEKIDLNFEWLVVDGIEIKENINNNETIIENDKEEENEINKKFFFKEITNNILSKEAYEFFESLKKILKHQMYDNNDNNHSKFVSSLLVLRTNSKLQILIPFILQYLFDIHEKIEINGFIKKNLIIIIINVLFNNINVNLEPHLHIIIKIIIKYMISKKLSLNLSDSENNFRSNAANILSIIVLDYSDKYINLKQNIFNLLNKNLTLILEQEDLSLSDQYIINGIFNFYYLMKSYDIEINLQKIIIINNNFNNKNKIIKYEGFIKCIVKIYNNNNSKNNHELYNTLVTTIFPYLLGINFKENLYNPNYIIDNNYNENEYLLYCL